MKVLNFFLLFGFFVYFFKSILYFSIFLTRVTVDLTKAISDIFKKNNHLPSSVPVRVCNKISLSFRARLYLFF